MPAIEDWKTNPHLIINTIFEENLNEPFEEFIKNVQDYFAQRLDEKSLHSIASLNSVSLDELRTGALVRYRCMVQDVFDPQFCLGTYKIINEKTQQSRTECGAFRDFPSLKANEIVDFESPENITVDRQGFYCVPIPGEADWVKEVYKQKEIDRRRPSGSQENSTSKRERDEDDDEESHCDQTEKASKRTEQTLPDTAHPQLNGDQAMDTAQEAKTLGSKPDTSSKGISLNFPLPGEKGLPCIVRMYSRDVELKTTDTVEIVGVLSIDPQLAAFYDDNQPHNPLIDSEELSAHEPPPSLVPRLHALTIQPLTHNNPLLPPRPSDDSYKQAVNTLMQDACSVRLELLSVLTHALLGDALAAEYLLCHLVASVYARADVLPLGKMTLNLCNCLSTQRYSKLFNHLIANLVPQSVLLEMSIDNTNSWRLVPKKDYRQNRLVSGMLQLGHGTSLVLDETALAQGTLDTTGVMNVRALADVINWQKVDYDFEFHPIPVHTNLQVCVVSEGESLLPKDFLVPLTPASDVLDIPAHFAKLDVRLSLENLNKLRAYLTVCRLTDYSVDEETQKVMQDDFVETRRTSPKDMTIEDFQRLLGLVRLLTLTYGQGSPTVTFWNKVRAMEEDRKSRLSRQPQGTLGQQGQRQN